MHERNQIGNVFPKYLTRIYRISSQRAGKLLFSLCFLSKKNEGVSLVIFGEVISLRLQSQTSGGVLCIKAINRQRFAQVSRKNSQDGISSRWYTFPCVSFA